MPVAAHCLTMTVRKPALSSVMRNITSTLARIANGPGALPLRFYSDAYRGGDTQSYGAPFGTQKRKLWLHPPALMRHG